MRFNRLLPRGLFPTSVHLQPVSRRIISSYALPELKPSRLPPMPKKIRIPEAHRPSPITQRRRAALGVDMAPGTSFKVMAEARIAILEKAMQQIRLTAEEPTSTLKKDRKREKKLRQHSVEIQELKRQIRDGPDADTKPPGRSRAQPDVPAGPKGAQAPPAATKAGRLSARLREKESAYPSSSSKEEPVERYQPPGRRNADQSHLQPSSIRRPLGSPQTPRPGWRPGHVDEPVVLQRQGSPDKAGRRDEIKPPSEESGGVPEPSNAYVKQALRAPRFAEEPRHILVIIDLNGALIHRPDRKKPTLYIARNSADMFLNYLFSRFKVMVWSAARPNNVDMMCRQLFPGQARNQLVAEWGRDKMGLSAADYNARTQVYKRLETVWDDRGIQACHPMRDYGGRWDQTNTVLIDDSAEKGRSHPFNLIKVPEFEGQKESEDVLAEVAKYLDDLLVQEDVSAFIQKKPFSFEESGSGRYERR